MDVCNDVSTVYFLIMMKSKSGDKSTRSTFSDFFGYFFSRKVYFSQIWWAIFLETIFLHLINMHMEKRSKFQTFSAHSIFTTIWPPGGTTCISWKFSHQVTPLAIVWNLADSWLHFHQLEICPPGNTKSIINRIGLCLVMKTMILTMVYLSWWAGSVQWRLQSLYDEVKIRRHVDKIYYLCLLKLFYFFSRKVYFSQIWRAIFFFVFHQNSATMWHHM